MIGMFILGVSIGFSFGLVLGAFYFAGKIQQARDERDQANLQMDIWEREAQPIRRIL